MPSKTCSKCGEEQLLSKFGKRKAAKDGKNEWCKECTKRASREYREQNSEKIRKADRECKRKALKENPDALREAGRKWYANNREKCKAYKKELVAANRFYYALKESVRRARKFGYVACIATQEELEAAFTGRCAICGILESDCKTGLHVDHCHLTGRLRGHLCSNCNRGLGHFGDSVEILQDAIGYLEKST